MYSVGEVLYAKCGFTDRMKFYIVSDVFKNVFGETVYELQSIIGDAFGYSKITEISKYMDWLHRADGLTLF